MLAAVGAIGRDSPYAANEATRNADALLARSIGVECAADLQGTLETAIKANKPYLVEVVVDHQIRPVGTGTWQLPPLPHAEPNFTKLARGS